MIKQFIINGLATPITPTPPEREWYFSTAGTGDGTTSGSPAPPSLFNPNSLLSGDRIYFNKGDSFYLGDFNISGLYNVQIGAFGTGANPIIHGSSLISTWIDNGDGYWYTSLATEPKWVCEDDVLLRQGESAWIPITAVPSAQVRRCLAATINAFSSIIGAKIVAKEFDFRASEVLTVSAYDSGTGNITFTGSLVGAAIGMPLKLYGQKQFATSTDDWAYDSSAQRLYLKTTNPVGRNIRVINQEHGIQVSNTSNFVFDGVDFKHYFKHAVLVTNSTDCSILNCEIQATRGNAIRAYGNGVTDLIIDAVEMHNCGLRGVELGGVQGFSITNCPIYDIGLQLNIGYPFDANKTGGVGITPLIDLTLSQKLPNYGIIDHCHIYDVGYHGIQMFGIGHIIRKNEVHDYCMEWNDGAGIYLYYNNGFASSTSGNLIQSNLVYDGNVTGNLDGITGGVVAVVGIYHDNGVNNNTIDDNVIHNPGTHGILLNFYSTQHIVTNNLVTGATEFNVVIREVTTPNSAFPFTTVTNCILTGNVLVAETTDVRCLTLRSSSASFNPFTGPSTAINNNHYVHPYGTAIAERSSNNGSSYTDMTLAQWKSYIAGDAAATSRTNYKVTPDADDVLVEINAADTAENFNTPGGYSDYVGAAFSNPVSIPAWYGLIYFQD